MRASALSTGRAMPSGSSGSTRAARALLLLDSPEFLAPSGAPSRSAGAGADQYHDCRPGLSLLPERIAGPPSWWYPSPLSRGRAHPGEARFLQQCGDGNLPPALAFDELVATSRRWRRRRRRRTTRLLALFLRLHRLPEGGRAPPAHMVVSAATPTRCKVLGMTEADRTFSAAKLFFAYGLGHHMYFPMRVGGRGGAYSGGRCRGHVRDHGTATGPRFLRVPTLYAAMLQIPTRKSASTCPRSRLRVRRRALPEELYKRWGSASEWRSSTESAPPRS